jgi:signal peptidase II
MIFQVQRFRHRLALVALVLLPSVGCDRATKEYAEKNLSHRGRISMLRDTVRLEYAENSGAFLSLGSTLPRPFRDVLLTGVVALMVGTTLVMTLWGRRGAREIVGLALIASGGVGNLWDRLLREGEVVDFMNLGIGPVRTGIFNVADIAIVAGVLLLTLVRPSSEPSTPPSPLV